MTRSRIQLGTTVALIGAWSALALPAIWVNSLAMLVAVVPLWRYAERRSAPVAAAD